MDTINWAAVEQWRDALRSGKYKQGLGRLRVDNNYCCLGVFCEAVVQLKPMTARITDERAVYAYGGPEEPAEIGALPISAAQALGTHEIPRLFGEYVANLNDRDGMTFDEIADLLTIALIEREGID